jgi:cytochrome c553
MKTLASKMLASMVLFLLIPLQASADTATSVTPDSIHIQRCSACHYVDGKSPGPEFPNIAGQYENYLIKALKLFKENKRESDAMELIASLHKQQELVILANYYAKQQPAAGTASGSANPSSLARGQHLYTTERVYGIACVDCHGADAKGYMRGSPRSRAIRTIPRLAGQQPGYLKAVLQKYTGDQIQTGMCAMRKAGKTLNQDDINALVEYISKK